MSEDYLKSPLIVWVQTFSIERITYSDLIDGYLLNEIFQQIDNRSSLEGIVGKVEDVNDRIQNWEILLKNVRSFYQEVLQQYIIMKPPDIFFICYQPDTASARDHIDAAILLLLGCAVQCEERGNHIQVIKELHVDIQHSIMQYIKQVTDFSKAVLNVNIPLKDIDDSTLTLYTHLSNLINQRDAYIQEIKVLHQALNVINIDDFGRITVDGQWGNKTGRRNKSSNRLSLINMEMSNLVGQAEYKAVTRKLKQELLDKSDLITELEDEMDIVKKNIQKLKIENFDLTQQARMGKFYRDELDIYKERAEVGEKLEKELQKYKDQMIEFDFLKDRVEELQIDNCILMDSRKVLEDQVESLKVKSQHFLEAEVELARYKKAVDESNKELEEYKEKMKHLTMKIEHFEMEKETKKRMSYMEDSLHTPLNFDSSQDVVGSLADQLLQASQSQIIALEAKLQKLELEMEDKFYFSENLLKAFNLNKATIRNSATSPSSDDIDNESDESSKHKNNEVFLSREDLEKEVLKRLALLRDDNERLKSHSQTTNQLLEQNQERMKSLESKNIKLSAEKQQLILNVESAEKKVKNLLEERDRLESELVELKKMADICLKRTRDLESCLEEVKAKDEAYLRDRMEFEKESKRLKAQLKDKSSVILELENNINEMTSEVVELRKASDDLKHLELKFHELEVEVDGLKQTSELDEKLISSLREELVNEKIKTQNLVEELSRMSKKCEAFVSGELVPPKLKLTEQMLEEKIVEGGNKQKKINELVESLDEQKHEVERLQSEVNSLLKKEELNASKDRTLIVTQRYGQSPGATQEILRLKDNLAKTQKHRDSLLQEVVEMRKQVDSLRSALDEQPQDDLSYMESLQTQLQRIQSQLASLQVEHTTTLSQNVTLESQINVLKASLAEGTMKMECLTCERNSLEDNCRALQKLHDKLGVEFERLQEDHGSLKGVHRLLKSDLKLAREKISSLEKHLEKIRSCSVNTEVTALKEENANLAKTVEGLENDNKTLSTEIRKSSLEIGRLKDSVQGLQRQVADNRSTIADLNVETERLRRIEHMYDRTEEENQILTDQLRTFKASAEEESDVSTENHQQQQKSLIERLSEMKNKSSKSDNQPSKPKKKTKCELTNSAKKNQSPNNESKSLGQFDSLSSLKKDCNVGSPIRKSQDDFISIETTPTRSESKTVSPFEMSSKFGDWKIKTVFRKNKSVDSAQQTASDLSAKKKSKRNVGTSDVDEETITLNQFLSECNQSPKSRRKFLIQKRVALDDDVFCDKNLPLDPRPPVTFESSQTLTRCGRSEGSIFSDGATRCKNTTPSKPKSGNCGRSGESSSWRPPCDDASMFGSRSKRASNSLHYSKSLQENFSDRGPAENQKFRNECGVGIQQDVPNPLMGSKCIFVRGGSPDVGGLLKNVDHQSPVVVLRKKESRELQHQAVKGRVFTSDGTQGIAVEDVPYQSDGVVQNLIKSYQKNSEGLENYHIYGQKEINFSKLSSAQTSAFMRPKSAGPSQERVIGRKAAIDRSCENDSHSGNPKVCMVRPATAATVKVSNTSGFPLGSGNERYREIQSSKSSQKSKTLYEYSCV